MSARSDLQDSASRSLPERRKPTHILTVEVPYYLDGGPFDAHVVKDAITAVLAVARVAGRVCDYPQASIREAEPKGTL